MSYKIVKDYIPKSKYSLKCPYTMTPIGITVHNTANDATAKNEGDYMERNTASTSFHVVIDEKEVRIKSHLTETPGMQVMVTQEKETEKQSVLKSVILNQVEKNSIRQKRIQPNILQVL